MAQWHWLQRTSMFLLVGHLLRGSGPPNESAFTREWPAERSKVAHSPSATLGWAASQEDVTCRLCLKDVVDPPFEGRGIGARPDAGAVIVREREPRPRDQPQ